jgi:hypothetical protein
LVAVGIGVEVLVAVAEGVSVGLGIKAWQAGRSKSISRNRSKLKGFFIAKNPRG